MVRKPLNADGLLWTRDEISEWVENLDADLQENMKQFGARVIAEGGDLLTAFNVIRHLSDTGQIDLEDVGAETDLTAMTEDPLEAEVVQKLEKLMTHKRKATGGGGGMKSLLNYFGFGDDSPGGFLGFAQNVARSRDAVETMYSMKNGNRFEEANHELKIRELDRQGINVPSYLRTP